MAKLKDIAKGLKAKEEILLGAGEDAAVTNEYKFLGEAGTKVLVQEINKKLDSKDAYIENGTITIKDESITPIEVDTEAEVGAVLTIKKVAEGEGGVPETEWKKIDFDGLVSDDDLTTELKKYVNDASYNSDSKEIELKNKEAGTVLAKFSAQPFLKDSFLDKVEIVTSTTEANSGKQVLKFTFKTEEKADGTAELTDIEVPLDDIFTPGNYYTKTEINQILYGANEAPIGDATGGLVKRIQELETKLAAIPEVKFGTSTDNDVEITIGSKTEKVLKQVDLKDYAKSEDVEKSIKEAIYGEGGSKEKPADDSIEDRLSSLESINVVEITAADVQKMFTDLAPED